MYSKSFFYEERGYVRQLALNTIPTRKNKLEKFPKHFEGSIKVLIGVRSLRVGFQKLSLSASRFAGVDEDEVCVSKVQSLRI